MFSKTKITESSELKQKLEEAQQEIGSLQKRVIEAEEDARRKAEEVGSGYNETWKFANLMLQFILQISLFSNNYDMCNH